MEVEEVQPEVEEPKVQTEEPKLYTEEQVKAQLKEQYDKLNSKLSSMGAEIKKLRETPVTQSNLTKQLVDEISTLSQNADDPQTQARINALRQQVQQEERNAAINSQKKAIELKRIEMFEELREAGVDTEDISVVADLENELESELWMGDGSFKRAERIKNKILKSVPKKENKVEEEKPKETEAQMRERIKRELLEEQGLTKNKELSPSRASQDLWAIEQKYVKGEIPASELPKELKQKYS